MNPIYILIPFALAALYLFLAEYYSLKKPDNEDAKRYAIDKSWNQQEKELRQSESVPEELEDIGDLNFTRHNFKRKSIIKRVRI